ncbi:HD domain-containing protein [Desulforamulus ruminis]|uniref:HD domain-containing protein n=1 Tax=Desulforamulus ruminis TaxID=1564 RepID=UPI002FD8D03C
MVMMASSMMKKMIAYFGADVKRINHALKVYALAKSIGELEGLTGEKLEILDAASILHDIGIKESERKYSSTAGKYQQLEGPPIAREFLQEFNLSQSFVERVCYLIGNHHTYTKIDDLDFQILVEADFLVNIFEGDLGQEQVEIIKEKYFKTKIGRSYLESMYLS